MNSEGHPARNGQAVPQGSEQPYPQKFPGPTASFRLIPLQGPFMTSANGFQQPVPSPQNMQIMATNLNTVIEDGRRKDEALYAARNNIVNLNNELERARAALAAERESKRSCVEEMEAKNRVLEAKVIANEERIIAKERNDLIKDELLASSFQMLAAARKEKDAMEVENAKISEENTMLRKTLEMYETRRANEKQPQAQSVPENVPARVNIKRDPEPEYITIEDDDDHEDPDLKPIPQDYDHSETGPSTSSSSGLKGAYFNHGWEPVPVHLNRKPHSPQPPNMAPSQLFGADYRQQTKTPRADDEEEEPSKKRGRGRPPGTRATSKMVFEGNPEMSEMFRAASEHVNSRQLYGNERAGDRRSLFNPQLLQIPQTIKEVPKSFHLFRSWYLKQNPGRDDICADVWRSDEDHREWIRLYHKLVKEQKVQLDNGWIEFRSGVGGAKRSGMDTSGSEGSMKNLVHDLYNLLFEDPQLRQKIVSQQGCLDILHKEFWRQKLGKSEQENQPIMSAHSFAQNGLEFQAQRFAMQRNEAPVMNHHAMGGFGNGRVPLLQTWAQVPATQNAHPVHGHQQAQAYQAQALQAQYQARHAQAQAYQAQNKARQACPVPAQARHAQAQHQAHQFQTYQAQAQFAQAQAHPAQALQAQAVQVPVHHHQAQFNVPGNLNRQTMMGTSGDVRRFEEALIHTEQPPAIDINGDFISYGAPMGQPIQNCTAPQQHQPQSIQMQDPQPIDQMWPIAPNIYHHPQLGPFLIFPNSPHLHAPFLREYCKKLAEEPDFYKNELDNAWIDYLKTKWSTWQEMMKGWEVREKEKEEKEKKKVEVEEKGPPEQEEARDPELVTPLDFAKVSLQELSKDPSKDSHQKFNPEDAQCKLDLAAVLAKELAALVPKKKESESMERAKVTKEIEEKENVEGPEPMVMDQPEQRKCIAKKTGHIETSTSLDEWALLYAAQHHYRTDKLCRRRIFRRSKCLFSPRDNNQRVPQVILSVPANSFVIFKRWYAREEKSATEDVLTAWRKADKNDWDQVLVLIREEQARQIEKGWIRINEDVLED
ncbi:unnamed protein product [Caenorhabditis sp. 36 PRJEB53466]|nr:unnamed protein product [Caenorhabditis sp. 36 PRJEB53466]